MAAVRQAANAATDSELSATLARGIDALGLSIDATPQAKLIQYVRLIEKWNRVHNLTAVRDAREMVVVHLLDCLAVLPHLGDAKTVLDVGTGAGLPAIVIALTRPDIVVTAIDSVEKKVTFLQQAKAELALANFTPVHDRVETWAAPQHYDIVISRAFADIADFVKLAGSHVASRGVMLAMKGVKPDDEVARVPQGFRVKRIEALHVPQLNAERHLIWIERS